MYCSGFADFFLRKYERTPRDVYDTLATKAYVVRKGAPAEEREAVRTLDMIAFGAFLFIAGAALLVAGVISRQLGKAKAKVWLMKQVKDRASEHFYITSNSALAEEIEMDRQ